MNTFTSTQNLTMKNGPMRALCTGKDRMRLLSREINDPGDQRIRKSIYCAKKILLLLLAVLCHLPANASEVPVARIHAKNPCYVMEKQILKGDLSSGTGLKYKWTLLSQPEPVVHALWGRLDCPIIPFMPTKVGDYVFKLEVENDQHSLASTTFTMTVKLQRPPIIQNDILRVYCNQYTTECELDVLLNDYDPEFLYAGEGVSPPISDMTLGCEITGYGGKEIGKFDGIERFNNSDYRHTFTLNKLEVDSVMGRRRWQKLKLTYPNQFGYQSRPALLVRDSPPVQFQGNDCSFTYKAINKNGIEVEAGVDLWIHFNPLSYDEDFDTKSSENPKFYRDVNAGGNAVIRIPFNNPGDYCDNGLSYGPFVTLQYSSNTISYSNMGDSWPTWAQWTVGQELNPLTRMISIPNELNVTSCIQVRFNRLDDAHPDQPDYHETISILNKGNLLRATIDLTRNQEIYENSGAIELDLLGSNVADIDGDLLMFWLPSSTTAHGGSVVRVFSASLNRFIARYVPATDFYGQDSFAFQYTDGYSLSPIVGRASLTVQPTGAVAGPDQVVRGASTATVDGSGSVHPSHTSIAYAWSKVSCRRVNENIDAPDILSSAVIIAPDQAVTGIILPPVSEPHALTMRLTTTLNTVQDSDDMIITILPAPQISFVSSDCTITEPTSSNTSVTINLSINGAVDKAFDLPLTLEGSLGMDDVVAMPTAVSIPASTSTNSTVSFNVLIKSDSLSEGLEDLTMTISPAFDGNAWTVGSVPSCRLAVIDSDQPPYRVSFRQARTLMPEPASSESTVNPKQYNVSVDVDRMPPANLAIPISINIQSPGLIKGSDSTSKYCDFFIMANTTQITIPAGATSKAIGVKIWHDTQVEMPEEFSINLDLDGQGLVAGDITTHTVTIVDTPPAEQINLPEVFLATATSQVPEGQSVSLDVCIVKPTSALLPIYLNFSGTALAADFKVTSGTVQLDPDQNGQVTINIPSGASRTTLTLTAKANDGVEPDEVVDINVLTNASYRLGSNVRHLATIPGNYKYYITASGISEWEGARSYGVTVGRGTITNGDLMIPIVVDETRSTAKPWVWDTTTNSGTGDYIIPQSITIPNGQNSAVLNIQLLPDQIIEGPETLVFSLGEQTSTTKVADPDPNYRTVVFTILEGGTGDTPKLIVKNPGPHLMLHEGVNYGLYASLDRPTPTTLVIPFDIIGDLTASDLESGQLPVMTIAANGTNGGTSFKLKAGAAGPKERPFRLIPRSSAQYLIEPSSGAFIGSVAPANTLPELAFNAMESWIVEGGTISMGIMLSKAGTDPITVNLRAISGSADPAADLVLHQPDIVATTTISAGSTTASLIITSKADRLRETMEDLNLFLESDTSLVTIPSGNQHVLHIIDQTSPTTPVVSFTTGSAVVVKNGGPIGIPVRSTTGDYTVAVSLSNNLDGKLTLITPTLVVKPTVGSVQLSASAEIPTAQTYVDLRLNEPAANADYVIDPKPCRILVRHPTTVASFVADSYSAYEHQPDGLIQIPVLLRRDPLVPISTIYKVHYTVEAGIATSDKDAAMPGVDFMTASGDITFSNGETQRSVPIAVMDNDQLNVKIRMIKVTLTAIANNSDVAEPSICTVYLLDDESKTEEVAGPWKWARRLWAPWADTPDRFSSTGEVESLSYVPGRFFLDSADGIYAGRTMMRWWTGNNGVTPPVKCYSGVTLLGPSDPMWIQVWRWGSEKLPLTDPSTPTTNNCLLLLGYHVLSANSEMPPLIHAATDGNLSVDTARPRVICKLMMRRNTKATSGAWDASTGIYYVPAGKTLGAVSNDPAYLLANLKTLFDNSSYKVAAGRVIGTPPTPWHAASYGLAFEANANGSWKLQVDSDGDGRENYVVASGQSVNIGGNMVTYAAFPACNKLSQLMLTTESSSITTMPTIATELELGHAMIAGYVPAVQFRQESVGVSEAANQSVTLSIDRLYDAGAEEEMKVNLVYVPTQSTAISGIDATVKVTMAGVDSFLTKDAPSMQIALPIGTQTMPVLVQPLVDSLWEGTETLVLRLESPVGATLGERDRCVVAIQDEGIEPPTFDPPPGVYTGPITVRIVPPGPGLPVYYTICDGMNDPSDPILTSDVYENALTIGCPVRIKARVLLPAADGVGEVNGPVASATYTIIKEWPSGIGSVYPSPLSYEHLLPMESGQPEAAWTKIGPSRYYKNVSLSNTQTTPVTMLVGGMSMILPSAPVWQNTLVLGNVRGYIRKGDALRLQIPVKGTMKLIKRGSPDQEVTRWGPLNQGAVKAYTFTDDGDYQIVASAELSGTVCGTLDLMVGTIDLTSMGVPRDGYNDMTFTISSNQSHPDQVLATVSNAPSVVLGSDEFIVKCTTAGNGNTVKITARNCSIGYIVARLNGGAILCSRPVTFSDWIRVTTGSDLVLDTLADVSSVNGPDKDPLISKELLINQPNGLYDDYGVMAVGINPDKLPLNADKIQFGFYKICTVNGFPEFVLETGNRQSPDQGKYCMHLEVGSDNDVGLMDAYASQWPPYMSLITRLKDQHSVDLCLTGSDDQKAWVTDPGNNLSDIVSTFVGLENAKFAFIRIINVRGSGAAFGYRVLQGDTVLSESGPIDLKPTIGSVKVVQTCRGLPISQGEYENRVPSYGRDDQGKRISAMDFKGRPREDKRQYGDWSFFGKSVLNKTNEEVIYDYDFIGVSRYPPAYDTLLYKAPDCRRLMGTYPVFQKLTPFFARIVVLHPGCAYIPSYPEHSAAVWDYAAFGYINYNENNEAMPAGSQHPTWDGKKCSNDQYCYGTALDGATFDIKPNWCPSAYGIYNYIESSRNNFAEWAGWDGPVEKGVWSWRCTKYVNLEINNNSLHETPPSGGQELFRGVWVAGDNRDYGSTPALRAKDTVRWDFYYKNNWMMAMGVTVRDAIQVSYYGDANGDRSVAGENNSDPTEEDLMWSGYVPGVINPGPEISGFNTNSSEAVILRIGKRDQGCPELKFSQVTSSRDPKYFKLLLTKKKLDGTTETIDLASAENEAHSIVNPLDDLPYVDDGQYWIFRLNASMVNSPPPGQVLKSSVTLNCGNSTSSATLVITSGIPTFNLSADINNKDDINLYQNSNIESVADTLSDTDEASATKLGKVILVLDEEEALGAPPVGSSKNTPYVERLTAMLARSMNCKYSIGVNDEYLRCDVMQENGSEVMFRNENEPGPNVHFIGDFKTCAKVFSEDGLKSDMKTPDHKAITFRLWAKSPCTSLSGAVIKGVLCNANGQSLERHALIKKGTNGTESGAVDRVRFTALDIRAPDFEIVQGQLVGWELTNLSEPSVPARFPVILGIPGLDESLPAAMAMYNKLVPDGAFKLKTVLEKDGLQQTHDGKLVEHCVVGKASGSSIIRPTADGTGKYVIPSDRKLVLIGADLPSPIEDTVGDRNAEDFDLHYEIDFVSGSTTLPNFDLHRRGTVKLIRPKICTMLGSIKSYGHLFTDYSLPPNGVSSLLGNKGVLWIESKRDLNQAPISAKYSLIGTSVLTDLSALSGEVVNGCPYFHSSSSLSFKEKPSYPANGILVSGEEVGEAEIVVNTVIDGQIIPLIRAPVIVEALCKNEPDELFQLGTAIAHKRGVDFVEPNLSTLLSKTISGEPLNPELFPKLENDRIDPTSKNKPMWWYLDRKYDALLYDLSQIALVEFGWNWRGMFERDKNVNNIETNLIPNDPDGTGIFKALSFQQINRMIGGGDVYDEHALNKDLNRMGNSQNLWSRMNYIYAKDNESQGSSNLIVRKTERRDWTSNGGSLDGYSHQAKALLSKAWQLVEAAALNRAQRAFSTLYSMETLDSKVQSLLGSQATLYSYYGIGIDGPTPWLPFLNRGYLCGPILVKKQGGIVQLSLPDFYRVASGWNMHTYANYYHQVQSFFGFESDVSRILKTQWTKGWQVGHPFTEEMVRQMIGERMVLIEMVYDRMRSVKEPGTQSNISPESNSWPLRARIDPQFRSSVYDNLDLLDVPVDFCVDGSGNIDFTALQILPSYQFKFGSHGSWGRAEVLDNSWIALDVGYFYTGEHSQWKYKDGDKICWLSFKAGGKTDRSCDYSPMRTNLDIMALIIMGAMHELYMLNECLQGKAEAAWWEGVRKSPASLWTYILGQAIGPNPDDIMSVINGKKAWGQPMSGNERVMMGGFVLLSIIPGVTLATKLGQKIGKKAMVKMASSASGRATLSAARNALSRYGCGAASERINNLLRGLPDGATGPGGAVRVSKRRGVNSKGEPTEVQVVNTEADAMAKEITEIVDPVAALQNNAPLNVAIHTEMKPMTSSSVVARGTEPAHTNPRAGPIGQRRMSPLRREVDAPRTANQIADSTRCNEAYQDAAQVCYEAKKAGMLRLLENVAEGACFLSGTPVLMSDGSVKDIDHIVKGDQVLTRPGDQEGVMARVGKVIRVDRGHAEKCLSITAVAGDGHTEWNVRCTVWHPFYTIGRGWTSACDLKPNDQMRGSNDNWKIVKIDEVPGRQAVYNFGVEGCHTYFVGPGSSVGGLWVHNVRACDLNDFQRGWFNLPPDDQSRINAFFNNLLDPLRAANAPISKYEQIVLYCALRLNRCRNGLSMKELARFERSTMVGLEPQEIDLIFKITQRYTDQFGFPVEGRIQKWSRMLEGKKAPSPARDYEAAASGGITNPETGERIVPVVGYDNPNGGMNFFRFDGQDPHNSNIAIDRKFGAKPPEACKDMVNGIATNTYNVLEQNPWLIIRYEVPNEFVKIGVEAIINKAIELNPALKPMLDQKRLLIQVVP